MKHVSNARDLKQRWVYIVRVHTTTRKKCIQVFFKRYRDLFLNLALQHNNYCVHYFKISIVTFLMFLLPKRAKNQSTNFFCFFPAFQYFFVCYTIVHLSSLLMVFQSIKFIYHQKNKLAQGKLNKILYFVIHKQYFHDKNIAKIEDILQQKDIKTRMVRKNFRL